MAYRREDIPQYFELQTELARRVELKRLGKRIRTIAGVDVSSERFGSTLFAGVVVLSWPELRVIEESTAVYETDFPYIPGLLSFRELPALLGCIRKLKTRPDVYMVDGQGVAHPRRLGLASHLGVALDAPTIGVAKSVLYGEVRKSKLLEPQTGKTLGLALRTKAGANPLIISPGHRITLAESTRLVLKSVRGYRLPEPTRLAHNLVNDFRMKVNNR